jgi:hypothetical protein
MSDVQYRNKEYLVEIDLGNIIWDLDGLSLDKAFALLTEMARGYKNPRLVEESGYEHNYLNLVVDRNATEDEIDKYKKKRKKDKEAKTRKREEEKQKGIEKDEAEIERLRETYPERFK